MAKKVLVVDDDPDIRMINVNVLEENGYTPIQAENGEEGFQMVKKEKPDLLILDVMMPRKNGYELCNEIKKDDEFKDITVLLLTAVADAIPFTTYTHMDGKSTLADDFIPKPIDLDNLMEIVRDNL